MPLFSYLPEEVTALILLFLVAITGLIRIANRIRSLNQRISFANEFFEKVEEYVKSGGRNIEVYSWLIHRSPKMQTSLGRIGIAGYRPPYANYMLSNYQIILNTLPELRQALEDTLFASQAHEYYMLLQETLLRYTGVMSDLLEPQWGYLKNPIVWLREGVQLVLLVPLLLLEWAGLITSSTVSKFSGNLIFSIFSGIVTILGLLSAMITIVLGWEEFVHIVNELLKLIAIN